MDDDLANKWFAEGDAMVDEEPTTYDVDDVPDLRRRSHLWYLFGGLAALMLLALASY